MKKEILLYLVLLGGLLFIPFSTLYAQVNETTSSNLPKEQTVYSPQVADMIRYDQTSLQLNTGCIDLNIPLTEWNDPDFDFPISLFYDSSGFRPRDTDNYVGRNWMLGIGGVVYRKVNGIPDDMKDYPEPLNPEYRVNGFMSILGKGYFNTQQMEANFRNNPYQYTRTHEILATEPTLVLNKQASYTESSADIFYFSFGKHSGKFVINYDGTVSACGNNGGKYEVDLSEMQMINQKENLNTKIHIKTDDGYIYTFGGEGYASLEYNMSWEGQFSAQPEEAFKLPHVITAFHLTEITAPNRRKLTIKYRDTSPEYHTTPSNLRLLTANRDNVNKSILMQYLFSGRSVYQEYNTFPLNNKKSGVFKATKKLYTLTKTALVESVSTGRMQLSFNYSPRSVDPFYGEIDHGRFPYTCGAKLDKIDVYSIGSHHVVFFSYNVQMGGRMFLSQVKTNDGTYAFKYSQSNISSPPTPMTSNIDHWGFWRGMKENNGIIPAMEVLEPHSTDYQDYHITSNDRNATGENFDYSILSKVSYPTGGFTTFEYEPNQYSYTPRPTNGSSYYPGGSAPMEGVALAGGARICTITHCMVEGNPVKKSIFTYGSDNQQGELTYMPYYKYMRTIATNDDNVFKVDGMSLDSEGITDLPYPSIHIRYPRVTEHLVSPFAQNVTGPHARKVTIFAERLRRDSYYYEEDYTYPTYEKEQWIVRPETYFPTYTLQKYNCNILAHPSIDISLEYGKVERELFYNEGGKLIKECAYYYNFRNKDKYALRTYTPVLHFGMRTGLYSHFIKEPLFEYVLDKKETITYSEFDAKSGSKNEIEFFRYDKNGLLTAEGIIKNNGDSLMTCHERRRFDLFRGFQILPVSKTLCLRNKEKETILQKDSISYEIYPNTIFDNYFVRKPSEYCRYDMLGKRVSQHSYTGYDTYGNLLSDTDVDGKQTVYIWGNLGRQLFARIENATPPEVERALGCTLDYYSKNSEEPSELSILRQLLPKSQIYTYGYTDSRLTCITAPHGQSLFYTYDNRGRLTETSRISKKGDKEIIQQNEYKIVND